MPLVVITGTKYQSSIFFLLLENKDFHTSSGLPCSGKSTAALKLASWLEEELGKKVELVCEEQMLGDLTKNQVESQV